MRKISIIHPSRNRPELASRAAKRWLSAADGDVEYILSLDKDESMVSEYFNKFMDILDRVKVVYNENTSAIDAINNSVQYTTGDILIVVSDDFDCPDSWDTKFLEAVGDQTDILVKTWDGVQDWIITLPIMDRAYYNRFGYIYYPEYRHMFADTEMTHVGDLLGRTIKIDMEFIHRHYTVGGMTRDDINRKNDSTWGQGELLYIQRLQTNFGIEKMCGKLNCHPGHYKWLESKGVYL